MEISGLIIRVLEARGGVAPQTGKPWKVQSYVLQTIEQYPRHLCFEVFGEEKISAMNIQEGQVLRVQFDVDAREYQGRWFNQIRAWRVDPVSSGAAPAATQAAPPSNQFASQSTVPPF